ncbi:unnamed protein product [Hermetia illucens]|uniref:Transglutaminase-like domain-containing protein n=1 Tax=Hermetia illucens TaxID=343691 RepID=A0A7R8YKZ0_HERIL|nr:hemocyte protein-glutamine gamma-glutamyltransferase-like [Hermetia illucens]CAD7077040.1 unnamed protein product [Hermetia illucens]
MALKIKSVDFHVTENARNHFTDRFEMVHMEPAIPVIRRGQKFSFTIAFEDRDYNKDVDEIKFIFSTGIKPLATKNTLGAFVFDKNSRPKILTNKEWDGRIMSYGQTGQKTLNVEAIAPADAPFGSYSLKIECTNGGSKNTYDHDIDTWILFNPWVKEDLVYMADTALLDEYILADVGKIWLGPHTTTRGREWVYGQFASHVLPGSSFILDRSKLANSSRGDPIKMVRAISRIVNSNDDNGVLVGRWDGEYEDGTAPSTWTGSAEILEEYLTKGESVKYGQCWVFSGVVATVCRAIGIPCRPVSNLVSAHDSNASLTVDKYFDKDNNEIEYDPNNEMGEDSIWNYHVWNDVYMARPDLPKGYGGWQAVDATPQETSDGFYQCGPASLEAIRRGEVGFNYDVGFMLSSVNADFVKWKEDARCPMGYKRILCNTYHIGKMILTKRPWIFDPNGDKDREDITSIYKYKEGTKEERLSVYNAVRNTRSAKKFFEMPEEIKEDVKFQLTDLEKVNVGDPFTASIHVHNTSSEIRNIEIVLSAGSVYYTGNKAKVVKRISGEIKLMPGARQDVQMTVKPDEYLPGLVEYNNMKIYAICSVIETMQTWAGEDDFQIIKPPINVQIEAEVAVGDVQKITLSFKNPLQQMLTGGHFNLSVPRVLARTIPIYVGNIAPRGSVVGHFDLQIRKPGNFTIVVTFASKQLSDMSGSAKFEAF